MISRRFLVFIALVATAVACFLIGDYHARASDAVEWAAYDAKLDAIRAEMRTQIGLRRTGDVRPAATIGVADGDPAGAWNPSNAERAQMVAEIKHELQHEMGLMPIQLLRERRTSFVELYTTDNLGKTNYGTAGYLGGGYFITVKHAVVALKDDDNRQGSRKITAIKVLYDGKEIP